MSAPHQRAREDPTAAKRRTDPILRVLSRFTGELAVVLDRVTVLAERAKRRLKREGH